MEIESPHIANVCVHRFIVVGEPDVRPVIQFVAIESSILGRLMPGRVGQVGRTVSDIAVQIRITRIKSEGVLFKESSDLWIVHLTSSLMHTTRSQFNSGA